MHPVLDIIRFVLALLFGGLKTARTEWACQPSFPSVEWMNVRPVPKRLDAPPDWYDVVPVAGHGGGLRRLVRHSLDAAGPFPPPLPVCSDLIAPRWGR